jgi:hypothetical protein
VTIIMMMKVVARLVVAVAVVAAVEMIVMI